MPPTPVDLAAIRARLAAATGDGGRPLHLDTYGTTALYYGDGDECSVVRGNLGLGYDATPVSVVLAHAPADLRALCDEVERLRAELAVRGA